MIQAAKIIGTGLATTGSIGAGPPVTVVSIIGVVAEPLRFSASDTCSESVSDLFSESELTLYIEAKLFASSY